MSGYAWLGVIGSASICTLALIAYGVMALPYLDNAPYWNDLKKNTKNTMLIGVAVFGLFFAIFYSGAQYLNQDTSGPLLIFTAFIFGLPISLLIGSETWDRHNGHGMSNVPGPRAIAVATSIGLAELVSGMLIFILLFQVT
jgi:hypothetical protein